jgi:hypothetical protein
VLQIDPADPLGQNQNSSLLMSPLLEKIYSSNRQDSRRNDNDKISLSCSMSSIDDTKYGIGMNYLEVLAVAELAGCFAFECLLLAAAAPLVSFPHVPLPQALSAPFLAPALVSETFIESDPPWVLAGSEAPAKEVLEAIPNSAISAVNWSNLRNAMVKPP